MVGGGITGGAGLHKHVDTTGSEVRMGSEVTHTNIATILEPLQGSTVFLYRITATRISVVFVQACQESENGTLYFPLTDENTQQMYYNMHKDKSSVILTTLP